MSRRVGLDSMLLTPGSMLGLEVISRTGADPGFLDRGFQLAELGSICAVCLIFPEIPHKNEII